MLRPVVKELLCGVPSGIMRTPSIQYCVVCLFDCLYVYVALRFVLFSLFIFITKGGPRIKHMPLSFLAKAPVSSGSGYGKSMDPAIPYAGT